MRAGLTMLCTFISSATVAALICMLELKCLVRSVKCIISLIEDNFCVRTPDIEPGKTPSSWSVDKRNNLDALTW